MNAVLERNTIESTEQAQHNAMIGERYRRLLDTIEGQLSAPIVEEKTHVATTFAPQAPVLEETPTFEQAPTVTEYSPVFTTEKFEQVEEFRQAEVQIAPVVEQKAVVKAAPTAVAQYSLTPLAKILMAAFALVVTAMLVLIGINSYLINQRSVRIQNLEEKKQELMERNEELQLRIQELQTEESILERAEQVGLLN